MKIEILPDGVKPSRYAEGRSATNTACSPSFGSTTAGSTDTSPASPIKRRHVDVGEEPERVRILDDACRLTRLT